MKTHLTPNRILAASAAIFAALALAAPVRAQVITSDPSLPVLYPAGQYLTPNQVHAMYNGPGLAIVLSSIQHRAFGPVNRVPSGPNEREDFNSTLNGLISVNGSPDQPMNASGPVTTEVFGKIGNTTGTFNTEMLSMNLSGTSPFGPFMIRESPTLASTGQTTVTDIGGGLYQIDSFFDVFTELSIDGGASWMPSTGSAHVDLQSVPEPSVCLLGGLAIGLLALKRFGRRS
jgi:hypothetical protein